MVQLHKIILLFVAAVSFFGTPKTAESANLNHEAGLDYAVSEQNSAIFSSGKPEIIGIHQQGRTIITLIRVVPVPNAKKSTDEGSTNPELLSEIPLRRSVSIYLCFSGFIHQSLSIRELLFPFHHFL
jgi:hypothetical protein